MRRDGGSVFPARANTGDPNGPVGGLSANEIARALISMMARSTKCSNRRPDTLMQDRTSANSTKSSCNARPDHTLGQERTKRHLGAMSALPPKADMDRRVLTSTRSGLRPCGRGSVSILDKESPAEWGKDNARFADLERGRAKRLRPPFRS